MLTPAETDYISDNYFGSAFKWERSYEKNNLWRRWHGKLIVIFPKLDGYGWVIKDGDGKSTFSNCVFPTEQDAINAVAGVLQTLTNVSK